MIKFYYHPSPNPAKVALFLEEAGLEYELMPVDTRKGEQHSPGFRAINPNGKTPAIVDGDATIFDSSAILLYLAEKTKRFLPENTPKARGELLSWLFFVSSGVGPVSGYTHLGGGSSRSTATRRASYGVRLTRRGPWQKFVCPLRAQSLRSAIAKKEKAKKETTKQSDPVRLADCCGHDQKI